MNGLNETLSEKLIKQREEGEKTRAREFSGVVLMSETGETR